MTMLTEKDQEIFHAISTGKIVKNPNFDQLQ